jgi:chorismate mutase
LQVTDKQPRGLFRIWSRVARRIHIAHDVALSKWDNGSPVEDAAREAQVIQNAVSGTQSKGLDAAWVTEFFRAQIEAN